MELRRKLVTPGWHRSLLLRRAVAALLLLAAGALLLRSFLSTDPSAVVFIRDVNAGDVIRETDVELRRVPAEFAPAGALGDTGEAVGKVAASSLGAGEVATPRRFIGEDLTASFVANITGDNSADPQTMVPLRLSDPSTIPLLHHGDTVSVVSLEPDSGGSHTIAAGGRVILGAAEGTESVLVLLPESLALTVAAASLNAPLTVVLTGDRVRGPAS
ncbi:SAF domain-containing protein [Corynebacterium pacaense]|uniref:SAF domain-containing protein n=1 Tax=Corynebacterium pacaense TaxID=1816684 RepID=UPI0009BB11F5|nr:SAF domain-containing protein [Corynebacterium pacaense]